MTCSCWGKKKVTASLSTRLLPSAYKKSKGFSLIEMLIVVMLVGVVGLAVAKVLNQAVITVVKSQEQTLASEMGQNFFAKLNAIPYAYVFSCDSSSASYGLVGTFGPVTTQVGSYPYVSILSNFYSQLKQHRFERFTLQVKFKIRDLGDLNGDSKTTDLRDYYDANGDGIDDYDPGVRYNDQNTDGDFFDTYATPEVTEEPHTRLKECTLKLYKYGEVVYQQTALISWEKFTGIEGKAAGASLPLLISSPTRNSAIYDLTTAARQTAFNLILSTSYPEDVKAFRGDSSYALHLLGTTTPGATFSWRLDASTNSTLDSGTADFLGQFDCTLTNLTAAMNEGSHVIWGQSYKNVYYSPWTPIEVIRDINPPTITNQVPSGTVPSVRPTVKAQIQDLPVTVGRTVSGINSSLIRLYSGTTTLSSEYDPITGYVTWIDSTTGNPPILSTGSYTVVLEGGDNAYYKVRSTWTFTLDLGDWTDNSEPSVSNKVPSGVAASNPPEISVNIKDNQSGINIETLRLSLDGVVVVSSTTGNLFTSASPMSPQEGYTLSYTPGSALSSGWHSVEIVGSHWANSPTNKITTEDTWSFFVP